MENKSLLVVKMVLYKFDLMQGHKKIVKLIEKEITSLQRVKQIGVVKGCSVGPIIWHEKINQIIVGCGDGTSRIFYDPQYSHNGALLCVTKAPREKDPNDFESPRPI